MYAFPHSVFTVLSICLAMFTAMALRAFPLPACIRPLSRPQCSMRATKPRVAKRAFSRSSKLRIMELTGFSEEQLDVRNAISNICASYPDEYWAARDESSEYPHDFRAVLAKDGWIGIALPEELGGAGLGISEATMMLQTISQSGAGIAGAQSIHANVYASQPVAKFATEEQRRRMLPKLISGEWKACFGVTEPRLEISYAHWLLRQLLVLVLLFPILNVQTLMV